MVYEKQCSKIKLIVTCTWGNQKFCIQTCTFIRVKRRVMHSVMPGDKRSKPRLNTHSRSTPALQNLQRQTIHGTNSAYCNTKRQNITYVLVKKQYFSERLVKVFKPDLHGNLPTENHKISLPKTLNYRVKCLDTGSGIILSTM